MDLRALENKDNVFGIVLSKALVGNDPKIVDFDVR